MGSGFNEGDSADRAALYVRLRGTGLSQIICLMAWLDCRQAMRNALRGGWVPDLAPTDELSLSVLALLQTCELVVPSRPVRSLSPAATTGRSLPWCSLEEWSVEPPLGAETTLLHACELAASGFLQSESSRLEAAELWNVLARGRVLLVSCSRTRAASFGTPLGQER
jgi:hypothetical protein